MPENSKSALKEQLPLYLIEVALVAAMLGVYALIGRLSTAAVLGAGIGTAVSIANHVAMLFAVLKAMRSESPQKGQLQMQGSYILRMLLLVAVFVAALKFLKTEPIATLLPLILMRIALFFSGLMMKKEGELPE